MGVNLFPKRLDVESDVVLSGNGVHEDLAVEDEDAIAFDQEGELDEGVGNLRQELLEPRDGFPQPLDAEIVVTQRSRNLELNQVTERVQAVLASSPVRRPDEVCLVPVLNLAITNQDQQRYLFGCEKGLHDSSFDTP